MPKFKTQVDASVSIEAIADWFAHSTNEDQIRFFNQIAVRMSTFGSIQLDSIVRAKSLYHQDIELTAEAKGMLLMLADMIREA
jgi:hypothetical protein